MALDVPEIPTGVGDKVAIGGPDSPLVAGNSFDREYIFEDLDGLAADFTGYLPTAEVKDKDGVVLETFTVTPAPGDATGTFRVVLLNSQTAALVDVAVSWHLTISSGSVTRTLICADFTVTAC